MRAALVVIWVVGAVLAFAGSVPAGDGLLRSRGQLGSAAARPFDEFPLYDAGDSVDGLPLVAVRRRDDTADFVSFVYGDCHATDHRGCAPPGEIQVWPACRRNLGLYESSLAGAAEPAPAVVRGVPAAFFDDGTRLEIQTGRSTVVVFAGSRGRVLRIAAALRPVGEAPSSKPLPQPEAGALDGTVSC
jgi:hypothetical protein